MVTLVRFLITGRGRPQRRGGARDEVRQGVVRRRFAIIVCAPAHLLYAHLRTVTGPHLSATSPKNRAIAAVRIPKILVLT